MKFAFQEGLFPYESEQILYLKLREWGFDAVEVWGEKLHERMDRVAAASQSADLPVCGICPGGKGIRGSMLSDDPELRILARKDILTLLRCAAELGGAGLNLVPEFGKSKFMALYPDLMDFENRKMRFLDELAPLAAEAEKLGVCILLEPLNRYESFFLITIDQAASLCMTLGSPAVKILADLFHMNIEDDDPAACIERNIRYIPYIHLADSNRRLPGHGHLDFTPVFQVLAKHDFNGAVAMECGIPGDPSQDVPAALVHIKNSAAQNKY